MTKQQKKMKQAFKTVKLSGIRLMQPEDQEPMERPGPIDLCLLLMITVILSMKIFSLAIWSTAQCTYKV